MMDSDCISPVPSSPFVSSLHLCRASLLIRPVSQGTVATTLCAPFDVVKSRVRLFSLSLSSTFADDVLSQIMNAAGSTPVSIRYSRWRTALTRRHIPQTLTVISRAFKTEGATWLFKGWTPAWIRLSPNTIILLFVYFLIS